MKLGDSLRELMEQNDVTQKHLARKLGITPAAVGNYIHNYREPDYNTLIRIADFFHVSTDFLLGREVASRITREEEVLLYTFRSLSADQKDLYLEQGRLFTKLNSKQAANTNAGYKEIHIKKGDSVCRKEAHMPR